MDNLVYMPGDLFSVPVGSILVHACNCQGTWGKGIAYDFKQRWPSAFRRYREDCVREGEGLRGQARFYTGIDGQGHGYGSNAGMSSIYAIGCLFTSVGYGWNVDHPGDILDATASAVEAMVQIAKIQGAPIHSPKFNSGLFRIPWADTEQRLRTVLQKYPEVKWTIWEK